MAYRVPRRFILPPQEPPPYGLLALSFLGHTFFLLAAAMLSAYLSAQIDQSKIYIVNLVPASPPMGSPVPPVAAPPTKAPEPVPPKPKAEPPPPPKPPKAETPPRPEKTPDLPPRAPERAQPEVPRRDDFALPRRADRELPKIDTPLPRERPIARTPPAPAPSPPPPPRGAEPSRVATPPAPPAMAAVRPGAEPTRPGRLDATVPATGSTSLDVSDFPFTFYLRLVQKKIGESWAPPRATAGGGEKTIVLFEIGRDGQIKEPVVERSSGNALYDQSALRAVMEASPFPPLPPEFKAPSLRVHFGFEFRPEQG